MGKSAGWRAKAGAWLVIAGLCGADAVHETWAAAPGDAPASVRISTADLDLSTDKGIETLYRRIRDAAREVCHRGVTELYLQSARTDKAGCYQRTIAATVAEANLPRLTSVYGRNQGG